MRKPLAILGIFGIFAFLVTALMLFGAISNAWDRHVKLSQWPAATATITECKVAPHQRRSPNLPPAYIADCGVSFSVDGKVIHGGFSSRAAYTEHRKASWGNPGIDELRAWAAQHPKGSTVAIHYDPSWPPLAVFESTSSLFVTPLTVELAVAKVAAIAGVVLLGSALFLRKK